jgi:hypothetical protein
LRWRQWRSEATVTGGAVSITLRHGQSVSRQVFGHQSVCEPIFAYKLTITCAILHPEQHTNIAGMLLVIAIVVAFCSLSR